MILILLDITLCTYLRVMNTDIHALFSTSTHTHKLGPSTMRQTGPVSGLQAHTHAFHQERYGVHKTYVHHLPHESIPQSGCHHWPLGQTMTRPRMYNGTSSLVTHFTACLVNCSVHVHTLAPLLYTVYSTYTMTLVSLAWILCRLRLWLTMWKPGRLAAGIVNISNCKQFECEILWLAVLQHI